MKTYLCAHHRAKHFTKVLCHVTFKIPLTKSHSYLYFTSEGDGDDDDWALQKQLGLSFISIISFNLYTICVHAQSLSHFWLFVTPWTIALQTLLSMGFSRQEYWNGLPFPSPSDLPNLGIEPKSSAFPALAGRFFTTEPLRKPIPPRWR